MHVEMESHAAPQRMLSIPHGLATIRRQLVYIHVHTYIPIYLYSYYIYVVSLSGWHFLFMRQATGLNGMEWTHGMEWIDV